MWGPARAIQILSGAEVDEAGLGCAGTRAWRPSFGKGWGRSDCSAVVLVAEDKWPVSLCEWAAQPWGRLRQGSVNPWEALWASGVPGQRSPSERHGPARWQWWRLNVLTSGCVVGRVHLVVLRAVFAQCGDVPQWGVPLMFTPWWLVTNWCPNSCWARFYVLAALSSLLRYWWADVACCQEWGWRMMLIGKGTRGVVPHMRLGILCPAFHTLWAYCVKMWMSAFSI
jgi:hypothetical protein